MFKVNYYLCLYAGILNAVLALACALVGTPGLAYYFIIMASLLFIAMKFFSVAIKREQERKEVMHNEGSNEYDANA